MDSNHRPTDYESAALTAVLRARNLCLLGLRTGLAFCPCPFLAHCAFELLHRVLRFRVIDDDVMRLSCGHVCMSKYLLNDLGLHAETIKICAQASAEAMPAFPSSLDGRADDAPR